MTFDYYTRPTAITATTRHAGRLRVSSVVFNALRTRPEPLGAGA